MHLITIHQRTDRQPIRQTDRRHSVQSTRHDNFLCFLTALNFVSSLLSLAIQFISGSCTIRSCIFSALRHDLNTDSVRRKSIKRTAKAWEHSWLHPGLVCLVPHLPQRLIQLCFMLEFHIADLKYKIYNLWYVFVKFNKKRSFHVSVSLRFNVWYLQ